MWLCLRRLRAEGQQGAAVGQTLYDLFNHDTERRVVEAGVRGEEGGGYCTRESWNHVNCEVGKINARQRG